MGLNGGDMGRANRSNQLTNIQARADLEATPGYTSSGEGLWSRQAASGGKVATSIADTSTMSRLELVIHRNTRELINFQERASTSSDPSEVARLLKNIGIKKKFLDRLRAEQRRS